MLGTFLATILKKYFFIVTTSYLGSFLIFRGFGSLFGNYPNVLIIKTKLPQSYYEYFGLIIGHTIFGIVIQLILKKYYKPTGKNNNIANDSNDQSFDEKNSKGSLENKDNKGLSQPLQKQDEISELELDNSLFNKMPDSSVNIDEIHEPTVTNTETLQKHEADNINSPFKIDPENGFQDEQTP